jgi:hypothetical protein
MTSRRAKTSHLAIALAAALLSSSARADEVVTAQALFDQAKKAMAAHDYAEACPKFKASLKLEEAIGTLLNLAVCYEKQGKLASAWSRFLEVEAEARARGQADRARMGRERAAALAPKVSNLVLDVPSAARVDGLEIRRDGIAVEQAEWGAAIPADAGPHSIEASASGRKPWSQTVTVEDGATTARVTVPELAPLGADVAAAAVVPDASGTMTASRGPVFVRESTDGEPAPGHGLRVAAVVVGSAGVAGIGVGAVFGLLSLSKHNDATKACPPPGTTCPTSEGAGLWNDAYSLGNVSTVAFVAGGVALATGVVLWLVAPRRTETAGTAAQLVVGPGTVAMRGQW